MRRVVIGLGLVLVSAGNLSLADDEPDSAASSAIRSYRVSIDGNTKIATARGGSTTRRTQVEIDYRFAKTKDGIDVAVDRFGIRVSADRQEIDRVEMTRNRLTSKRADRAIDVRRNEAPPALKALFEQFDPPLASIKLDEEGGEDDRKMKEQEGPLSGTNLLELARAFHPKFPGNQDEWEAPITLPFGRGQTANGTLKYTKKPSKDKDGNIEVDITGSLKVTGKHDLVDIDRGEYKVIGKQTYDPSRKEWTSGRMQVAIQWEATAPNGVPIQAKGTAAFSMTRRTETATAKSKAATKKR
jgi:hypothetical protein